MMPRDFSRTQRVADHIRRELAGYIQTQMRDPRIGMVMVNEVEVSRDLAYAKVFVTVLGKDSADDAREALAVLNDASGFLRSQLAKGSTMRVTPKLKFVFDSSVLRGQKLSRLIDQAIDADQHSDMTPAPSPERPPGGEGQDG